jgi:DNA helicase HerA-like ATPase
MSTPNAYTIKRNERVVFLGRTGSGKTTLADKLIRSIGYRTVVFDPKHAWEFPGYKLVTEYDPDPHTVRQLFRPRSSAAEGWSDADGFLRQIWSHRIPTIVYIDEITKLSTRYRTLPILEDIVRLGRQVGIGAWYASQRPRDCPTLFFTEAEHWMAFDLRNGDDRKRVAEYLGERARNRLSEPYSFWYANPTMPDPILVRQDGGAR